jgi:hypothetical protein
MPREPGPGPDAPEPFARFRALVLADGDLQEQLGNIEDAAVFIEQTVEAARARGLDLKADDLGLLSRGDPLGVDRFSRPILIDGFSPRLGWLPAELSWDGQRHTVTWAYVGRRRLVEPFYEDSLRRALRQPFNRLFRFRAPLSQLEHWPASLPNLKPDGFIFHMSRCGSTLAAQMLGAPPAHIVVSEAPPIDAVVRMPGLDDAARVALLRAMVGALGQVRVPGERRYFIKLDSWHALALPLFRRAFPDTPWVFLYRDPVEVMVSQSYQRGLQMVPEFVPPAAYGLDLPDGVPNEDYWARVLASVCAAALRDHPAGGGALVNYHQLPGAVFSTILPHFGIEWTEPEHQAMVRASLQNAKAPGFAFSPDSDDKRRAATAEIHAACARRLDGVYRRLEDLRLGGAGRGPTA